MCTFYAWKADMHVTCVTINYDLEVLYTTELFFWVTDNLASGSTMMEPICLIENQKNCLRVNPSALKILQEDSQPVVVVAIVGMYRTGKSYLMNRLAGQNRGEYCSRTVAIYMLGSSDHTVRSHLFQGLLKGEPNPFH